MRAGLPLTGLCSIFWLARAFATQTAPPLPRHGWPPTETCTSESRSGVSG